MNSNNRRIGAKDKIRIVLPHQAPSDLVYLTEYLTKNVFGGEWQGGGLLGGEFGYGVDYENDTFMMFPYYWGDCTCGFDDHEFTEEHQNCYQNELEAEKIKAGWKKDEWGYLSAPKSWSYDKSCKIEDTIYKKLCAKHNKSFRAGCAVHCTCDYQQRYKKWLKKIGYPTYHKADCLFERPNFLFKPTGAKITWYKYIGRDQQQEGELPLDWLKQCIDSVTSRESV